MIYTCTTNPSLDYYISCHTVEKGITNRSDFEFYDAGGKGVNVSIVLSNFQIPSVCLGFLGGFVKDFYLSFLNKYKNIQPLFTSIKENSRINVKLMDAVDETAFNAKGPNISKEEFNKFKSRMINIYTDDIFVLSGNIQDEIEEDMFNLICELNAEGIKVVLDTDKTFIDKCLDIKPFMIKINDYYLKEDNLDVNETCEMISKKGAKFVMYSAAHKPSYLYTENKNYKCENLVNSLTNATGTSDAMVAGFLYGVIRGADPLESFKYANAANLAGSISDDQNGKEKMEMYFNKIEVNEF